jgi:hypothetical protein
VIPLGLALSDEPYIPEQRRLYWLRKPLLDAGDPEPERPGVVLIVPGDHGDWIRVGMRSSTEQNGQFHVRHPRHRLTKDGYFSRSRSVNPELWTPNNAESIDLLLDDETFAYVWNDLVQECSE